MGLQGFERRLERLVEGTFNKAFRSGLQPVEIGHQVARASSTTAARSASTGGRVAPNNIGVYLSPADFERFSSFAEALARELAEAAREHARDEGYQFLGPVTLILVPDDDAQDRRLRRRRRDRRGRRRPRGLAGAARRPAGPPRRRITSPRPDSRLHGRHGRPAGLAAPRRDPPHGDGFVVADLGSMNGTLVNGRRDQGAPAPRRRRDRIGVHRPALRGLVVDRCPSSSPS